MKLSELITTLQTTLDDQGDTDEIALCFVIEGKAACRLDVFGSVTVLHDTAEYPSGMAYLVADCNVQPARLTELAPTIDQDKEKEAKRILEAAGIEPSNAPHEGRTAASSPGVPLDAVVGGQKSALTGRQLRVMPWPNTALQGTLRDKAAQRP